ncbi:MAG: HIT domain-containing protein [Nanoarchaeota archaeon]|nr:HIT domain-containing protein [Nanoarchaeota archaeon]
MALTPEQIQELRRQLHEQVKNLPDDKRAEADKQIDEMSGEAIEEMLNQQMAAQEGSGEVKSDGGQKGIFRMLVDGDIPSKKDDENKDVIAIISKKAISKGHCLIIPKKVIADSNKMPNSAFTLAKKLAKKMDSKLKANGSVIVTEGAFGEVVLDVIPIYDKQVSLQSPRYDASDEEVDEVYDKLRVVKREKKQKVKIASKEKSEDNVLKLRRRIP